MHLTSIASHQRTRVIVAQLPVARVSLHRAHQTFRRREQGRVRRHFRDVLAELAAAPRPDLTSEQRATRARLFDALAIYRRTSRFPRNLDFAGRRAPYFIDAVGTRCAVAHLMEQSGAVSLMHRIAAQMNNAYVRELAPDAEVGAWLASVGLTLEEAARIQPSYCGPQTLAENCCGIGGSAFPPSGAVEGVVESVDATSATILVQGAVHGTVGAIKDGRVVVPDPGALVVNDAVVVLSIGGVTADQETSALAVDAKGEVATPCYSGPYADPPAKMGKATLLAMADGGACVDAIVANEPATWDVVAQPCDGEDDGGTSGGCGVGGAAAGGGAGAALIVLAAASMRFRWRAQRARRARPMHAPR